MLGNKSLIRYLGVKYHRIFVLVVRILTRPAARQNTAQLLKIYGDSPSGLLKYNTTLKNIRRYFTNLIRF